MTNSKLQTCVELFTHALVFEHFILSLCTHVKDIFELASSHSRPSPPLLLACSVSPADFGLPLTNVNLACRGRLTEPAKQTWSSGTQGARGGQSLCLKFAQDPC